MDTVSIEENRLSQQIQAFPNPVTEFLSIKNSSNETLNFRLYNSKGELLIKNLNSRAANLKVNLAHLPKGIYLLNISDGVNHFTKKIIKN